jgi:hypothetical protein
MSSGKKRRKKKKQDFAKKLQQLRSNIKKAKSKLDLVEKEVDALLDKAVAPPWHYGPKCPHGGSGGGP